MGDAKTEETMVDVGGAKDTNGAGPETAGKADKDEALASESLSLDALLKHYDDYLTVKSPERYEQRTARHYYHADQWTAEELRILRAPDPMAGPAQQMAMAKEAAMLDGMKANIAAMQAKTEATRVKTAKDMADAMGQTPDAQAELAETRAELAKTRAGLAKTAAEIGKIKSETAENIVDAARNASGLGR